MTALMLLLLQVSRHWNYVANPLNHKSHLDLTLKSPIQILTSLHMQAFCDTQKDFLEHSIASLPNQASSADDYTKMSWAQVERKVTG